MSSSGNCQGPYIRMFAGFFNSVVLSRYWRIYACDHWLRWASGTVFSIWVVL